RHFIKIFLSTSIFLSFPNQVLHSFPTRRFSVLISCALTGFRVSARPAYRASSIPSTRSDTNSNRLRNRRWVDGIEDARYAGRAEDRKSTRLNSSHVAISYAVFCLKKKKMKTLVI